MKENSASNEKPKKKKKKVVIIVIILVLLLVIGIAVAVVILIGSGKDKGGGSVDVEVDNSDGDEGEGEGKLAISFKRDLSNQTQNFQINTDAKYVDATYIPDQSLLYNDITYSSNLPDDIAKQEGMHSIYQGKNKYSFFSFSFWIINTGTAPTDVNMRLTFRVDRGDNKSSTHIEEAVRFMLVTGEPLLSDKTYTIYKKAEKEGEDYLYENPDGINGVMYDRNNVTNFISDTCVFDMSGDSAYKSLAPDESIKVTIVIWVEGCDRECVKDIVGENIYASLEIHPTAPQS